MKNVNIKSMIWTVECHTGKNYPIFFFEEELDLDNMKVSTLPLLFMDKHMKDTLRDSVPFIFRNIQFTPLCKLTLITHCVDCGTKLKFSNKELLCPNLLCSGKAVTSLYRLVEISCEEENLDFSILKSYFQSFPVQSTHTNLLFVSDKTASLMVYLTLFKQIGPKDILPRRCNLSLAFGSDTGDYLWKIESAIQKKLTNLTHQEFWYILNLSEIGKNESELLKDVSPWMIKDFIEKDQNHNIDAIFQYCWLSANARASVLLNSTYWAQILSKINLPKV